MNDKVVKYHACRVTKLNTQNICSSIKLCDLFSRDTIGIVEINLDIFNKSNKLFIETFCIHIVVEIIG